MVFTYVLYFLGLGLGLPEDTGDRHPSLAGLGEPRLPHVDSR